MSADDFARIPVTVLEIDQDFCQLEYGTSPCTAELGVTGDRKCYNCLATCQDTENYDPAPLTLRFSMRDRAEGFDEYVIPSIDSVRTDPTRINVGGRRGRDKPLGVRAQGIVTLTDHPHSDLIVDKYVTERDFDPMERGTFWSKWLRRNPFYVNRPMRIREGFAGQALEDMQVRHYVIEKIEGPNSSGGVTITGQDVLRLADDDKAQCPRLSSGTLLTGIDDTQSTMTVTGDTIESYQQLDTKAVRISDEVIRYDEVTENLDGDLEFTGLVRGSDGTEATDHDAEDTVQGCAEFMNEEPWEVARVLLTEFGNVDEQFINFSDWVEEAERWLTGFFVRRLLTEPEGVTELLGQLSEQCLFFIWWDERVQEVRFRAVAPVIGAVPLITERGNLLRDSVSIRVRPEQRASEVWASLLLRNAVETGDERKNYRRTRARIDPTASSQDEYRERRVYEVFSPWLVNNAQVDLLTFRLLSRYRRPPEYLSFSLDIKDRELDVAEVFDVEYRGFVDDTGATQPVRYQVISVHESPPGERIKIEAQRFDFGAFDNFGNWMVESAPVYTEATDEQKDFGTWWANDDGKYSDGSDGVRWA